MKSRTFTLFENAIKSEATKIVYENSLHAFMKFAKIKNYDDIVKLSTNNIHKLLCDWIIFLSQKPLKSSTIRNKLSAVELFLDMNRKTYHRKILHKLIPSDDYVRGGDVPFTTEEIQRFLDSTTKPRTKAIIHFLASTGTRPGVITDPILRLKHLEDMPNGCKAVKIYDGSNEGYWAFLTPEATQSMKRYFKSREYSRETLTPESPVFRNYEKSNTKKQEHLSTKSLRQILYELMKASGISRKKTGNRYDKAAVYGFRKRFHTILKLNNEVNSNIAEKLMAHKRGWDGSYLKPTKEQCFAEFEKAITELTIDPTERQKSIIAKKDEAITELQRNKERIENLEHGQQEMLSILNLKDTINMFEDPKKIKYIGLDGREITDEKDRLDLYKDYAAQADYMKKEVKQLSDKYKIKVGSKVKLMKNSSRIY